MAHLSGNFHRPLSAMAAVVIVAASSDFLPNHLSGHKLSEANSPSDQSSSQHMDSLVSHYNRLFMPVMSRTWPQVNLAISHSADLMFGSSNLFTSPPALLSLYQYAKLSKTSMNSSLLSLYQYAKLSKTSMNQEFSPKITFASSDVLYQWHLPDPNADGTLEKSNCSTARSRTVVVLLGWLGSKQKHLKRYADWYTSRGFNAVTFTFPMSEIVSYKAGGKAEKDLELLACHLADWVAEERGKNLVFHTFSNTGWLIYGVILENFQKQNPSVLGKIKGCIVDSAPVAEPNPQVWALGFSAAFLKKQSVATKGIQDPNISDSGVGKTVNSLEQPKPAVVEAALLTVLETFFEVILKLPAINRRLSDLLIILSMEQPKCPQLYVYSSADRVIPAEYVESFVEMQRKAGHEVRACNFGNSPHVDHFRNHPILYSSQLTSFLEDCVLACCKDSS